MIETADLGTSNEASNEKQTTPLGKWIDLHIDVLQLWDCSLMTTYLPKIELLGSWGDHNSSH